MKKTYIRTQKWFFFTKEKEKTLNVENRTENHFYIVKVILIIVIHSHRYYFHSLLLVTQIIFLIFTLLDGIKLVQLFHLQGDSFLEGPSNINFNSIIKTQKYLIKSSNRIFPSLSLSIKSNSSSHLFTPISCPIMWIVSVLRNLFFLIDFLGFTSLLWNN